MNNLKAPFPVDSLPPLLAGVVREFSANSHIPEELSAPLVLGVASLACQGAVDVIRPNCEPSPCLLYTIVVSGSGTRKTSVVTKLLSPIFELEQELADEVAAQMPDYEAAVLAWDVEKKYLLTEIERKAKKNEVAGQLQERLATHIRARPERPKAAKFIYEDPTPEALVDGLCHTWHSAAVISSEGGGFLNGRPLSDLPMWNRLWDGAGLGVERIGRGTISARNARGGLIVALQDGQFKAFLDSRGAKAMDIGFLGRVLISCPPRNVGLRHIRSGQSLSNWDYLKQFQARVKGLLRLQIVNGGKEKSSRTALEFTPEAEQRWIGAFNTIESFMLPGGEYNSIPSYASKIAENAARIAAIFHSFEGKDGKIQFPDIDNALRICGWYVGEFLECFGQKTPIPLEYRDAEILEKWLLSFVWNVQQLSVRKNEIRQFGPNQLRNKIRLDNALRILIGYGRVGIVLSQNKTKTVQLNSAYFSNLAWVSSAKSSI